MNNHEQEPQIPVHTFGEGGFANTLDPNEEAFFKNAKKSESPNPKQTHIIEVQNPDSAPEMINVKVIKKDI